MKKLWCLLAVLTLSFVLSGCGVELTDRDNRIIAEYAADLLLEYDKNYQGSLVELEADSATDTEGEPETESSTTEPDSTDDKTEEADTTAPVSNSSTITDIADTVGLEGVSIVYSNHMFTDQYPSQDQEGSFISLDADPGYKLLILEFNITNQTDEDLEMDLLHAHIDYQLVVNDVKAAKPMLTILMDDLNTLQSVVPAEGEEKAVLIFQISEGMVEQVESLNLQVTYSNKEYMLHIQ